MTTAKAKYDDKIATEARLQTELNKVVGEYLDSDSNGLWRTSDIGNELFVMHQYNLEKVKAMLRRGFAAKLSIPWKKLTESKAYNSYCTTILRIAKVACIDKDRYQAYRNSGRKFSSVWKELDDGDKNKKRNLERIAGKDKKQKNFKEQLKKDAAAGVTNAKELLATYVDEEAGEKIEREEEPGGTHTYFGKNLDREWKKQSKEILRDSPQLYIEWATEMVEVDLLTEEILELLKTHLKVS